MKVRLLARARRDVDRFDAGWREERPAAASAFLDELERAVELLGQQPDAAPVFTIRGREPVRRLLLPVSRAHVSYVRRGPETVIVLRVWGAVRGRPPSLR